LQGFLCLLEEEKNEVPSFDISLLKERGNATHAATPRFTSDVFFSETKNYLFAWSVFGTKFAKLVPSR
jgi:hypothetical protein